MTISTEKRKDILARLSAECHGSDDYETETRKWHDFINERDQDLTERDFGSYCFDSLSEAEIAKIPKVNAWCAREFRKLKGLVLLQRREKHGKK